MAGRYAAGPEYVDQLEGSAEAKQRARVILQTLQGDLRVQEACRVLGVCEQRFHQLREEMLQAAVARMEARPAGRPRRAAEPAEVQALKELLVARELELRVARLREEIALAIWFLLPDNTWLSMRTRYRAEGIAVQNPAACFALNPLPYSALSA